MLLLFALSELLSVLKSGIFPVTEVFEVFVVVTVFGLQESKNAKIPSEEEPEVKPVPVSVTVEPYVTTLGETDVIEADG